MAKWADYLISGIWKDKEGRITDVMLHEDSENNFKTLGKTSEAAVIKLLDAKKSIITIVWNYPDWKRGASVTYETSPLGRKFLKTEKNAKTTDNLDNSLLMSTFLKI